MRHRGRLFWIVCLGLAAPLGCNQPTPGPTIPEANPQSYVEDLPVPKGFELMRPQSQHTLTPGRRRVHHVYQGRDGFQAVVNFYNYNMPRLEWSRMDSKAGYQNLRNNIESLNYQKGDEVCEIRIERVPGGVLRGELTQVTATIRSQGDNQVD